MSRYLEQVVQYFALGKRNLATVSDSNRSSRAVIEKNIRFQKFGTGTKRD